MFFCIADYWLTNKSYYVIRKRTYSWIECVPGEMEMVIRSGKKLTSSESWCMCLGEGQRRLNLSSVITGGTGLNAVARI